MKNHGQSEHRIVKIMKPFFLLLLTSSGTLLLGQTTNTAFEHLTTSKGLSQNSVFCILQDVNGFMWFGTQAGLDRFDGVDFQHYSSAIGRNNIRGGYITALLNDSRSDYIWVGSEKGLSGIDLRSNYHVDCDPIADVNITDLVVAIKENRRRDILVATPLRIYLIRQKKIQASVDISKIYAASGQAQVTDLLTDIENDRCLVATTKGMFLLDTKSMANAGSVSLDLSGNVEAITALASSRGTILISVRNHGLYSAKLDPASKASNRNCRVSRSFMFLEKNKRQPLTTCSKLFVDSRGGIWAGTDRNGLVLFKDNNDGKVMSRSFDEEESLSSMNILSLYESRDSTLWIGTDGGGVNKFNHDKLVFKKYFSHQTSSKATPNNDVWAIYQLDDDHVLIGTDGNGIINIPLKGAGDPQYFFGDTSSANVVRAIERIKNKLLIGTDNGLYLLGDKPNNYGLKQRICGDSITTILAADEYIWIGTSSRGIRILDRSLARDMYRTVAQSIGRINFFLADKNKSKVWVCTSKGLFSIDNTFKINPPLLKDINVSSASELNGVIWVTTRGNGLYRIDPQSSGRNMIRNYRKQNGLQNEFLYGILSGPDEQLWLSTNRGLISYDPTDSTFNSYTPEHGLQNDEFNTGAFHRNVSIGSKVLFFGGVTGFNSFVPSPIRRPTNVNEIRLLYSESAASDTAVHAVYAMDKSRINVNEGDYATRFDVRLLDFRDPHNNMYRYRLNGADWQIEQPLRNSIHILRSDLYLGSNTLELAVRASNGSWTFIDPIEFTLPFTFKSVFKHAPGLSVVLLATLVVVILMLYILWIQHKRVTREKNKSEKHGVALQKQNDSMGRLQNLINAVSRTRTTADTIHTALSNLVSEDIFQFDYAIFYELNYLSGKALEKKILFRNAGHHTLSNERHKVEQLFLSNGSFSLKEKNDEIHRFESGSGGSYFPVLNSTESRQVQYFVPVYARTKGDGENFDKPLAILELGHHLNGIADVSELTIAKLKIYADNIAQVYQMNYHVEEIRSIDSEVITHEKGAADNIDFYKRMMDACKKTLGATDAVIAFFTFDNKIEFHPNNIKNRSEDLHQVITSASFTALINHVGDYAKPETLNGSDQGFKNIGSILTVPLINLETTFGVICLLSDKPKFFNEFKIKYVADIAKESVGSFFKLKLSSIVESLVSPFSFYDREGICRASCTRLRRYFDCSYLSFFENDINQKWDYRQTFLTPELQKEFPSFHQHRLDRITGIEPSKPTLVQRKKSDYANSIEQFAFQNDFESLIYVPLKTYKGVSSFIVIYCKRKVKRLFPEDFALFNLISTKTILSLAYSDIFNFFRDSAAINYDRELDQILSPLTSWIQKISGTDLLLFFPYDSRTNSIGNVIVQGKFRDPRILDRFKVGAIQSEDFSHIILNEGTKWIRTPEEYYRQYRKDRRQWQGDGEFKGDFWEREGVLSLAAIKIEFAKEPLGVMFFNYRALQRFDRGTKTLLELVTNLVGRIIALWKSVQAQEELSRNRAASAAFLAENETASDILHNLKNMFNLISYPYEALSDVIMDAKVKKDDEDAIMNALGALGDDIEALQKDYRLYMEFLVHKEQNMATHNLLEIVQEALHVVRFKIHNENIDLQNRITKDKMVYCDRKQFTQVILNLVKNSIEAKAKKIWLTIGTKEERLRNGETFEYTVIEVNDNGKGILEADMKKIFNRNFSTKWSQGGTGIGLPMSKKIMEDHQGRLDVASVPHDRTTFSILLPIPNKL